MAKQSQIETVADALADELALAGVDRVFGLPGGEVLPIMDALRRRGIEFVLCRHEADAGFMAAVYGKLKGVVGVVLTTLGPGAANLMLPITNSWLDREPLLAISAEIPASWPGSHTHQRLPLHEVYRPVTKLTESVNGYNVRLATRRAIGRATEEPLGPALLTIAADVAASPSLASPSQSSSDFRETGGVAPLSATADPATVASELAEMIGNARRPAVLVGLGTRAANAEGLRNWLDAWGLPVGVTPKVKGIVDETADNFIGVVGGMSIDSVMNELLEQSDLLIGFGFDPVELDKLWHVELPVRWVLESPQACDVVPGQNLFAVDHAGVLRELGAMSAPAAWENWTRDHRTKRAAYVNEPPSPSKGTVFPTEIVRALATILPAETIVATDVGSHKYLFGQFWPSQEPNTFFMSNGLSGMGYGLPAAIGAKLAHPEAPVLAVLGDGGFSMNSQELETARRIGAPVITVVLADRSYSLIRHGQEKRGLPNYGVDFEPIDSVLTAEACGVRGARVNDSAELVAEVEKALADGSSVVIEVPVDPDAWRGLV